MIYEHITKIDSTSLVMYCIYAIGVTVVIKRINPGNSTVLGLVAAVIVCMYLRERAVNENDNFDTLIDTILDSKILRTDKNKFLFHNVDVVLFLDNYREYYQYNPTLFGDFVGTLNDIFRLAEDMETDTTVATEMNYEMTIELRLRILNLYQAFIYTVPHTQATLDKYHYGSAQLGKVLALHLDKVRQQVARQSRKVGVNTTTKFPYKNVPSAMDPMHDVHYNFYS